MIDENVLERLKPYLTEVSYPKGYVLFNNEKLERNIYFIKRGMARAWPGGHDLVRTGGRRDYICQRVRVRGERLRDYGAFGRFGTLPGEWEGFTGFVL